MTRPIRVKQQNQAAITAIQGIGRDGRFKVDKKLECDNFLGKFKARIMARNLPREKLMMADHYSPVQAQ